MNLETRHRFILLRHGQSQWNLENRFTGWTDVELTKKGLFEAQQAALKLKAAGFSFDIAYTSVLRRAKDTLKIVLEEMRLESIPIHCAWQLNERHYGALQGLNKAITAERLGKAQVMDWRRSYSGCPPLLDPDDPRHPRFDPLYTGFPHELLPGGESLQDTERRVAPYWEISIRPLIQAGISVLVVAHGNSLRALVRYLDQIPPDQVPKLDIPTGVPIIYDADCDVKPLRRQLLPIG